MLSVHEFVQFLRDQAEHLRAAFHDRGAHAHGGRAGHDHLGRVLPASDSAQPDNGQLDCLADLSHGA